MTASLITTLDRAEREASQALAMLFAAQRLSGDDLVTAIEAARTKMEGAVATLEHEVRRRAVGETISPARAALADLASRVRLAGLADDQDNEHERADAPRERGAA